MKRSTGFTLIELMIVVAIIAILAAIALPAYQNYTVRAQVAEGVTLASGAKTGVTEFYSNAGTWPVDNTAAGLAQPASIVGTYTTSVAVTGSPSTITASFGNQANDAIKDQNVLLQATTGNDGSIVWTCTSNLPAKYLPTSCR